VSKEWFTREEDYDNRDTVWIALHNGPGFEESDSFDFTVLYLIVNEGSWYSYLYYTEIPENVLITDLSSSDGVVSSIIVTTKIYYESYSWTNHAIRNFGAIKTFDAMDLEIVNEFDCGEVSSYIFLPYPGETLVSTISIYDEFDRYLDYHYSVIFESFGADSVYTAENIWQEYYVWNWKGYTITSYDELQDELGISFGVEDMLYFKSIPGLESLWSISGLDAEFRIRFSFGASSIFDARQAICEMGSPADEYRFYNIVDGSLSAVLPDPGHAIFKIADSDSDGNDAIFTIDGRMLYIFGLEPTAVDDEIQTPGFPHLSAAYPNPFNSSTIIEYSLPEAVEVSVEIFDLLGRKVQTLVKGKQDAGIYSITWDAGDQASGVYFYRITAGEFVQTRRMVLLK